MDKFSVRDIVFLNFPFSDLSDSKKRPALVLANVGSNDMILCQITSQAYTDKTAILITESDLSEGKLIKKSYIRPSKLFTANAQLVHRVVASLNDQVHQKVINQIIRLLRKNG